MIEFAILFDDQRVEIIGGGVQYNSGRSLRVESKYTHDCTNSSQSITRRRGVQPPTASLSWVVNEAQTVNAGIALDDYLGQIESLVGREIRLLFGNSVYTKLIVTSCQIAAPVDSVTVFGNVSIALSLATGTIKKRTKSTKTATIVKNFA